MANSDQLRANTNQHKPKNTHSKGDDKELFVAMQSCITYLKNRFPDALIDYEFEYSKQITFGELITMIRHSKSRDEYDTTFSDRAIKPDGGVIFLIKKDDTKAKKILLISEAKHQGTNKQRLAEGKPRQAQGNAIERLGKNLTGIRAALNHEQITPFVCFGSGCDFEEDYTHESFVMSKVSMLNEFYSLNKTYVFKKDHDVNKNSFAPVSMYFREEKWSSDEMFTILKEEAETALRYYIH